MSKCDRCACKGNLINRVNLHEHHRCLTCSQIYATMGLKNNFVAKKKPKEKPMKKLLVLLFAIFIFTGCTEMRKGIHRGACNYVEYGSWVKYLPSLQLGMTKKQVLASWGKPEDINRTITSYGTTEQWVYGRTYLYFKEGILTSYQD